MLERETFVLKKTWNDKKFKWDYEMTKVVLPFSISHNKASWYSVKVIFKEKANDLKLLNSKSPVLG